jgi:hypothetical protein
MKVEALNQVTAEQARELYRKYEGHREGYTAQDQEIAAIYKRIAQGKTVIRAMASIVSAGLNAQGLPVLALARADERKVEWRCHGGWGEFTPAWNCRSKSRRIRVNWDGLRYDGQEGSAVVPIIPIHLRPKRGIANYHVLWEADWRSIPKDPYLLRRFAGDAWLVVAAWDLTDVERAVMAERLNH